MQIKAIQSDSSGNVIAIIQGDSSGVSSRRLLLDAGVPYKRIATLLESVDGVFISHEHQDHCNITTIKKLLSLAIPCYMSQGTAEALGGHNYWIYIIKAKQQFQIRDWSVLPFDLKHNAKEPLGFLIKSGEERLLYVCDTGYVPYKFTNLNYILIECNYALDALNAADIPHAQKKKIVECHMEINTVKEFLKTSDLSSIREIWLLHLSRRHASATIFKEEIQKATGCIINIA